MALSVKEFLANLRIKKHSLFNKKEVWAITKKIIMIYQTKIIHNKIEPILQIQNFKIKIKFTWIFCLKICSEYKRHINIISGEKFLMTFSTLIN